MNRHPMAIGRDDWALMIVDIQEKLMAAMSEKRRHDIVWNTSNLLTLSNLFDVPVIVSEQYPQGLGQTIGEIRSLIKNFDPVSKVDFSCMYEKELERRIAASGKKKMVLAGIEAHVCVLQTAYDLLNSGFDVHVASDAVGSRTDENLQAGLRLMEKAGAHISTTEIILFQALGKAGTKEFKEIQRLLK